MISRILALILFISIAATPSLSQANGGGKEIIRLLVETTAGRAYLQTTRGARIVEEILGSGARIKTGTDIKNFVKSFRKKATQDQLDTIVADLTEIHTLLKETQTLATIKGLDAATLPSYESVAQIMRDSHQFRFLEDAITPPLARVSLQTQLFDFTVWGQSANRFLDSAQRERFIVATEEQSANLQFLSSDARRIVRTEERAVNVGSKNSEGRLLEAEVITERKIYKISYNTEKTIPDHITVRANFQMAQANPFAKPIIADQAIIRTLVEGGDAQLGLTVSSSFGDFNMLYLASRTASESVQFAFSPVRRVVESRYHYFYERALGTDGQIYYVLARVKQARSTERLGYDLKGAQVEFKVIKETDESIVETLNTHVNRGSRDTQKELWE